MSSLGKELKKSWENFVNAAKEFGEDMSNAYKGAEEDVTKAIDETTLENLRPYIKQVVKEMQGSGEVPYSASEPVEEAEQSSTQETVEVTSMGETTQSAEETPAT